MSVGLLTPGNLVLHITGVIGIVAPRGEEHQIIGVREKMEHGLEAPPPFIGVSSGS